MKSNSHAKSAHPLTTYYLNQIANQKHRPRWQTEALVQLAKTCQFLK
ncbi:hypothetical protein ACNUDM_15690 [Vibrio chaetopteri]|jgi:hypothetical protein